MIKIKKLTYILFVSLMFSMVGCSSKKKDDSVNYDDLKKQGYEIAYTNGYKENQDIVKLYRDGKKTKPYFTYKQKNDKLFYSDSDVGHKAINVETGNIEG